MIEAIGLTKFYGDRRVVEGVSFTLPSNETCGLLGLNGAGKTTTIRMLTTYLSPTEGRALVGGFDITKEPERVREVVGYLPEHPPLYPEMRVREFVTFAAGLRRVPKGKIRGAVDVALERFQLGDVAHRLCGELSRGYRQRVGLAQAVVHEPKVVILDEPTSGLDPVQIVEVRRMIRKLGEGRTIIFSSHILAEVMEVCSRVLVLANGRIADQGDLRELTRGESLEDRFLRAVNALPSASQDEKTPRVANFSAR